MTARWQAVSATALLVILPACADTRGVADPGETVILTLRDDSVLRIDVRPDAALRQARIRPTSTASAMRTQRARKQPPMPAAAPSRLRHSTAPYAPAGMLASVRG